LHSGQIPKKLGIKKLVLQCGHQYIFGASIFSYASIVSDNIIFLDLLIFEEFKE
jgi:hypothetical protein